jgi:small-conductance mechanosensitive channel
MSSWQIVLLEPAKTVLTQISQFLVNVLLVVIILIIGWVIAKIIRSLVTKLLRTVKLDQLSDRIDLDNMLAKGGINYSLSELIGVICYWLALLVTFVVAINAIGLTVAADLLNRIVLYVPNIIAAMFILILGMFVATLLSNIVKTAANNAGLSQSKILGKVVEVAVFIFAVVMALEQLGVAMKIVELVISIVLASLGLGAALAFGLGCKDIAGRYISDLAESLKSKK